MTLYQLFSQFMHIYFWVFLVCVVLLTVTLASSEYKKAKENAIRHGRYEVDMKLEGFIAWTLWFMSWYY